MKKPPNKQIAIVVVENGWMIVDGGAGTVNVATSLEMLTQLVRNWTESNPVDLTAIEPTGLPDVDPAEDDYP